MIKYRIKQQALEAVKQNGWALQYASKQLRNDKDVVLEAVKQNGWALQYASKQLRNDKDVVMAAVTQNEYALEYASQELKNDKLFTPQIVKENGNVHYTLPKKSNTHTSMSNPINPAHYKQGKYEVIDVIKDQLPSSEFKGFCKANVLKYIIRADHKNQKEDLLKAKYYLDKLITEYDQTK